MCFSERVTPCSSCLPPPGDMQCKHLCRAVGNEFMVSREDSFIDGTRCEQDNPEHHGAFSLCVMGSCRVSDENPGEPLTRFCAKSLE